MPVDIDHARPDLACPPQGHLQEVLGGDNIPLGRQHKIDGLARGVNGSVEVCPHACNADGDFIDPPGTIGWPKLAANPLVQFWRIAQHPTTNGEMIDRKTSLHHELFQITQGQAIS